MTTLERARRAYVGLKVESNGHTAVLRGPGPTCEKSEFGEISPKPQPAGEILTPPPCEISPPYVLVTDPEGLHTLIDAVRDTDTAVPVDLETTGLDPRKDRPRLLSLVTETDSGSTGTYLVDLFAVDPAPLLEALAGKRLLFHNAAFDLSFLARLGFVPTGEVHDTLLLARLLLAGTHDKATLAACCKRWLDRDLDKAGQKADWTGELTPGQMEYAATDVEVLPPLLKEIRAAISEAGLADAARVESEAIPAIAWMSDRGVSFDLKAWDALAGTADRESERLRQELHAIAPDQADDLFTGWDWNSPQQMQTLFHLLGFPVEDTADGTLAKIDHPLAALLRQYRAVEKKRGTYGHAWTQHVADDGRVYPSWNQIGAASGRMSCSNPNMQQIPRDGEYRRCIAAPPGRVLLKADYSQIELRIAAKVSGDSAMLTAYRNREDLHTQTARLVLGVEDVTKEHRQLAKALNFGLLYGMGWKTFQAYAKSDFGMDLSDTEAQQYRDAFFKSYPGLKAWHRKAGGTFRGKDSEPDSIDTRTLIGRRRLGVKRFTEKLNTPVQGSGADGLKVALALLWQRREQAAGAFPVLVVHDELVVECDESQIEAATVWVRQSMLDAMTAMLDPVPVEVEVKTARTWGG